MIEVLYQIIFAASIMPNRFADIMPNRFADILRIELLKFDLFTFMMASGWLGGNTIRAMITNASERLCLKCGERVLVVIKASSVMVGLDENAEE